MSEPVPTRGPEVSTVIVNLLYFLVFRGLSQSRSETQLHRDSPRCDQENDHTSSAGQRSVESLGETVSVVVSPDLHQQAKTKHDQDDVDKPLSTETDGSVKDGEKRSDRQNHPGSMFAVVDKSLANSKTLSAISNEEASWRVSKWWIEAELW